MKDFTMIAEQSDYLLENIEMLNLDKFKAFGRVLDMIKTAQNTKYVLIRDNFYQSYLERLPTLDDDTLEECSMRLEA